MNLGKKHNHSHQNNKSPKNSAVHKKKLLTLAVFSSTGIMSFSYAGDIFTCDNSNCDTAFIQSIKIDGTKTLSLTTSATSSNQHVPPKRTDSLEGNVVTLDRTDSLNLPDDNVSYALGAFSNEASNELKKNKIFIKTGKVVRDVYGAYSLNAHVIINEAHVNGTVGDNAYGGKSKKGNATKNKVFITNGVVEMGRAIGGLSLYGEAKENEAHITDSTVKTDVMGGYGDKLTSDNTVKITGSNINGKVIGGKSDANNTLQNKVIIGDNSSIVLNSYGGYSKKGNATLNNLTINTGGKVSSNVFGGYSKVIGDTKSNEVHISGEVIKSVFGGDSSQGSGKSVENIVTIDEGNVGTDVNGGRSTDGDASQNSVTISSGIIGNKVTGGLSKNAEALSNTVTMTGGKVVKDVYGGASQEGKATDNIVNVSGGEIGQDAVAGFSKNNEAKGNTITSSGKIGDEIIGGYSVSKNVVKNNVEINGGSVAKSTYGAVTYKGNATNNSVLISNGTINKTVYGGYVRGRHSNGTSVGNTVTVSGGIIGEDVIGGMSRLGDVKDNIVNVSDGEITRYVTGGLNDDGTVSDNHVVITGGKVNDVAGGYSDSGVASGNNVNISGGEVAFATGGVSYEGSAINNTVTIKGNPIFNLTTIFYGGNVESPTTGSDAFTGNTLNLHSRNIIVSDVKNFENYNFYLGNDVDKGSTMLKLTSTDATDLSTSKYGVGVKTGTTSLPQGYTVTLIESATTLTLSSPNPANDITNMTDIVSGYEFRLSVKDGNKLVAELPYTVTIINSDTSKGSVSNESEVAYHGETITFDATPLPGYKVSINNSSECGPIGSWSGNTYTSSEITRECTITVNWEELNYTIGTIFSDSFE